MIIPGRAAWIPATSTSLTIPGCDCWWFQYAHTYDGLRWYECCWPHPLTLETHPGMYPEAHPETHPHGWNPIWNTPWNKDGWSISRNSSWGDTYANSTTVEIQPEIFYFNAWMLLPLKRTDNICWYESRLILLPLNNARMLKHNLRWMLLLARLQRSGLQVEVNPHLPPTSPPPELSTSTPLMRTLVTSVPDRSSAVSGSLNALLQWKSVVQYSGLLE